jgi:hypothetical protein
MTGLMVLFFVERAHAADVTVAWDPNPEPTIKGYFIYYGTSSGNYSNSINAGNATRCVISGLLQGVTYYLAVTAYDGSGNESGFSNEISYSTSSASSSASAQGGNSSSGGGGCFIATAAFGSSMAQEVAVLREFRDNYLLTNRAGTAAVQFYYWVSPPIADVISRNENLKRITRIVLTPIIYGVKNIAITIALILLPAILWILHRAHRKRRFPETA